MSANAQHYTWAAGHGLMFAAGLRYIIGWVFWKSSTLGLFYKIAFTGALMSYAIVVKKSLGLPSPSGSWWTRALADENFQYFLLAIFWTTSKPVPIALIPYLTFSAFHAATFTRTTVVPKFFPPTPQPGGGASQPSALAKSIQSFVKKYYDPSMKLVAYVELAIFARVFFGVFLFLNPILTPLFYGFFLRQRYFQSPFTRQAFAQLDQRILEGLSNPQVTNKVPQAPQYYATAKAQLGRVLGSTLVPQEGAAANPPPTTAGGARRTN